MKNSFYALIVPTVVVFLFSMSSQAGWMATAIPAPTHVRSLAVNGDTLLVGTDSSKILRSPDNGDTWTISRIDTPPNLLINSIVINGANIFAATDTGVFRSSDGGKNWTRLTAGLTSSRFWSLAVDGNKMYAGGYPGGIYVSADSGASWTSTQKGNYIQALAVIGANVIASDYMEGSISLSSNNGMSWKKVGAEIPEQNMPLSFATGESGVFATIGKHIYRSLDSGATWAPANSTPFFAWPIIASNGALFAAYDTVFMSKDNGATWTKAGAALPNIFILALAVNKTYLFAGNADDKGKGGLWRLPLSEASVGNRPVVTHVTQKFVVSATGKNNPALTIKFSLSKTERVTIQLITLSGREIASIVNNQLSAGPHCITYSNRNILQGCSIVKMQTESGIFSEIVPGIR